MHRGQDYSPARQYHPLAKEHRGQSGLLQPKPVDRKAGGRGKASLLPYTSVPLVTLTLSVSESVCLMSHMEETKMRIQKFATVREKETKEREENYRHRQ